jgi:hypothetical protein
MTDPFAEVNEMSASGISEFASSLADGERLILIGSFDLSYYHDVEVMFHGVRLSTCPADLRWPVFREGEPGRYLIQDEDGTYEVHAAGVSVQIGRVYYYDRGDLLKPGEQIAEWVQRSTAPGA